MKLKNIKILREFLLWQNGSINERIAHKEYQISLTKDLIHTLEGILCMDKKYIQEHYDKIEDLKKSIEHDRDMI